MTESKYPLTADLAGVLAIAVQQRPQAGFAAASSGNGVLVRVVRAVMHRASAWRVARPPERSSLDSATLVR